MPEHPDADKFLDELSGAGARLIAALAEQASLGARSCKHPDDEGLNLGWAQARQEVQQCLEEYCRCLERSDFPDVKIRELVEGSVLAEFG